MVRIGRTKEFVDCANECRNRSTYWDRDGFDAHLALRRHIDYEDRLGVFFRERIRKR
jgi:hypothetical protein